MTAESLVFSVEQMHWVLQCCSLPAVRSFCQPVALEFCVHVFLLLSVHRFLLVQVYISKLFCLYLNMAYHDICNLASLSDELWILSLWTDPCVLLRT